MWTCKGIKMGKINLKERINLTDLDYVISISIVKLMQNTVRIVEDGHINDI
jgi:hypothetical protein